MKLAIFGGEPVRKKAFPIFMTYLQETDEKKFIELLKTRRFSSKHGKKTKEYEELLRSFFDVKYAKATSSGVAALMVALESIKSSEIITSPLTHSTPNAIVNVNKKVIFSDVSGLEDPFLDPKKTRNILSKKNKNKAILPVHLFYPSERIVEFTKIKEEFEIPLIEDISQVVGNKVHGKLVGTFGDISCFSTYEGKILSTGEGGAIITDNTEYARKIEVITNYGEVRGNTVIKGYNFRISEFQALLGILHLERMEEIIKYRKNTGRKIRNIFKKYSNQFIVPKQCTRFAVHLLPIYLKVKPSLKNFIIKALNMEGIPIQPWYIPYHLHPLFSSSWQNKRFPEAEEIHKRVVLLPLNMYIGEQELNDLDEALFKVSTFLEEEVN